MGYILPDNMDFDVNMLLKVPQFVYKYDNDKVIEDWRHLFGDLKRAADFYKGDVRIRAVIPKYTDMKLKKDVYKGDEYVVSRSRADDLVYEKGWAEIVE